MKRKKSYNSALSSVLHWIPVTANKIDTQPVKFTSTVYAAQCTILYGIRMLQNICNYHFDKTLDLKFSK